MSISQQGPVILKSALRRLDEISRLEPDWDSYGAQPASIISLEMARAMLLSTVATFDARGVPTEVMPIADGGIQIEWRFRGGELALNAAPDGSWSYLLIDRGPDGRTFTERYGLNEGEARAIVVDALSR